MGQINEPQESKSPDNKTPDDTTPESSIERTQSMKLESGAGDQRPQSARPDPEDKQNNQQQLPETERQPELEAERQTTDKSDQMKDEAADQNSQSAMVEPEGSHDRQQASGTENPQPEATDNERQHESIMKPISDSTVNQQSTTSEPTAQTAAQTSVTCAAQSPEPEVSSTTNLNVKPQRYNRASNRRSYSYQSLGRNYVTGSYQNNYGLTHLPYKSNFEPSEAARRRADQFFKTLNT